MEYTFEVARETAKGDEVVTEKDATVIVDAKAVLFLLGTELDFKTDRFSSTFVFNNPNQVSACGCGESVEIKPRAGAGRSRRTERGCRRHPRGFRGYLAVRIRLLFGGHGIYDGELIFALESGGEIYLKTDARDASAVRCGRLARPFIYSRNGSPTRSAIGACRMPRSTMPIC
jgi:hypothetical protein